MTYNNFFSTLDRDKGVGHGAVQVVWRLAYDNVGHTLKPQKPMVVAKRQINLLKGQPVRIAWQD